LQPQQAWNPADPPPAITVHVVAGLAPEFLLEIDAVAVVGCPCTGHLRHGEGTPLAHLDAAIDDGMTFASPDDVPMRARR
jgi:hypothetical protein